MPSPAQRAELETLLVVADGQRFTTMDRLRKAPTEISARGLVKALHRYSELAAFGAGSWDLSAVPAGRIAEAARYARAARAQAVDHLEPERRMATLVAFAATMTGQAADDALDVFDLLVGDLMREARHRVNATRLRSLKDLDEAAWLLREAWLTAAAAQAGPDLHAAVAALDTAALDNAAATIETVARDPEEVFHDTLLDRYATLRRVLPALLTTLSFAASGPGRHTLDALRFLCQTLGARRAIHREDVPAETLTPSWHTRALPDRGEHAGGHRQLGELAAAGMIDWVARVGEGLGLVEAGVPSYAGFRAAVVCQVRADLRQGATRPAAPPW